MPELPPAVHRTIIAVDVEGFGNQHRINPQQVAVREGLYRVLRQAFRAAAIPWADCHHEDRGDGILILARPEVAKSVFVESLPGRLVEGLREHNGSRSVPEQIRLRMALHAGELHYDEHGVTGASINLTFRLLDAAPLKSALAGSPGVLGVVTSSWFFDEVVRHSPAADPDAYRRVRVTVKETNVVGWVHLPDHPYPSRDIILKDPLLGGLITAVPHQLPSGTAHFVGRAEELDQLSKLLDSTTEDGATVVISAVSGTAGVGKTALALRWAHRVRDEFPDGQLYVNLRGYDPEQPLSSGDALAGFLRALGLAGAEIPLEVDERAAAYRSLLDGRRMLVVLDNAGTVEQVRPLLPGTPSAVVVTSRDALAGLVARDGAQRLDLDLLPAEDAVALLGALIGERVAAEPEAAAALAGQCARLPLALRLAAELAAARPTTPLAALVAELADEQRRLELFDAGGDPRTAIRVVFSWSYQYLPAEAARAFRLLGLHPGPDLDPYAAAALTHTSLEQTQHLLDLLARAHLMQTAIPGRYGMHDLLRAYATYLATAEDSEEQRWVALTRLFDHYLATAAAAMDTLHPAEKHRRPGIRLPATPIPPVTDTATARAWLDTERVTLTAVCAYTATHGWPVQTIGLADTLFRYLQVGGHYPNAVAIHTHALNAARDTGDRTGEAYALTNLGAVYWRQGHYQRATERLQQALTLFRAIGDRVGEARALGNLGNVYGWQGHYGQAAEHHQQALTLFVASDDQIGEARTLDHLGFVGQRLGHYEQATDYHQQALTLFRAIGHQVGETSALDNLGAVYRRQGHYGQAAEHHQQALTLAREVGNHHGEATALESLGIVYQQQGRYRQA
ncbi:MAG: tetratricopeptide repeat protein, partial [Actinomycetota bacterium]|nr:tetratricopeptide repeat protein [Actinomycetota bacterium]